MVSGFAGKSEAGTSVIGSVLGKPRSRDGAGPKDLLELYARKDGSQMDGMACPRAQASGNPRTSGHRVGWRGDGGDRGGGRERGPSVGERKGRTGDGCPQTMLRSLGEGNTHFVYLLLIIYFSCFHDSISAEMDVL